ncbi:astacin-like metalloprotease toxin 5 [Centruroides sculpturatus]|uniref:astacin-like metalloprotease toxin 5 n=1 Tax=Centruroides sculpturatus TaxID=218467 RepID=UPI000C6EEB57|nr:astacin-like metalloprotease toxin 5 [Centruroides sculpturatus]
MICLAIFLLAFSNITNNENSENFNQEYSEDSEDADLALENPDLFGGDIIGDFDDMRNAIPYRSHLWPGGIIPYVIDEELRNSKKSRLLIRRAMKTFREKTCIRFKPKTKEKTYVEILDDNQCYSMVGRSKGINFVSLTNECMYLGAIIHQLNHIVGFYHEQNRPDRDEYVEIVWENIKPKMESQFVMLRPNQMRILNEFDYHSIMLYGGRAFSKDRHSQTMVALKPGARLRSIKEKAGLSKSDVFRINTLYHCFNSTRNYK